LETAANLLELLEPVLTVFSKYALQLLDYQADFDSAVQWANRLPKQPKRLLVNLFCALRSLVREAFISIPLVACATIAGVRTLEAQRRRAALLFVELITTGLVTCRLGGQLKPQ
jgi:hypothetical protein